FGEDEYVDGLAVLLSSYATDEKLTPLGQKMSRVFLRDSLAARLLSEAAWQQYPEYSKTAIDQPIFITGLPRSGTTALHRLLTADPRHQGLELWLTTTPQPRPPRELWAENPIYSMLAERFRQHHVEHPEFMGMHHLGADQPEECWRLLCQSMRSISFECLAHLPTYSSWLEGKDWTDAYRRHKRNLQLIGMNDADKRWVLKNPSHLFALDELLAVYPDALIIQTHRLPRVVIGSACSLSAHATAGWSERFVGAMIGADQLELWARGLDEFMAGRAQHDQARFCDVWYDDFVTDPIATIESIYGFFGIELTGAAADAMRAMTAESVGPGGGVRRDASWRHQYSLADFGLTAEQVDERFSGYLGTRG
ncbi:MAG TPA: sulfotransferase, partial [Streptosporangiaceae bacterium]|nr:sulfotransferase [Streptosporangiaceae bacterium]